MYLSALRRSAKMRPETQLKIEVSPSIFHLNAERLPSTWGCNAGSTVFKLAMTGCALHFVAPFSQPTPRLRFVLILLVRFRAAATCILGLLAVLLKFSICAVKNEML